MTGHRLTGPTIRTGPGDSKPPEATPWDELTGDVEALRRRAESAEQRLEFALEAVQALIDDIKDLDRRLRERAA